MKRTSYKVLQRAIARDEKHSILSRWEYGHAILADPRKIAASGLSLRHGAAEALIADAKAAGTRLSDREIRRRLQCARAYKTINEIGRAMADFETWSDLAEAGFPAITVDEAPPATLFDDEPEADPPPFEQLGLFPAMVKSVPLEEATVGAIVAYTDEMSKMTASYARSDARRRAFVAELRAAVNDDLDVLYIDALAKLTARRDSARTART